MANVPSAIVIIVMARTRWRPILSPSGPKNSPPSGRTTKAAANMVNVAISDPDEAIPEKKDLADRGYEEGEDPEVVPLHHVADRGTTDRALEPRRRNHGDLVFRAS